MYNSASFNVNDNHSPPQREHYFGCGGYVWMPSIIRTKTSKSTAAIVQDFCLYLILRRTRTDKCIFRCILLWGEWMSELWLIAIETCCIRMEIRHDGEGTNKIIMASANEPIRGRMADQEIPTAGMNYSSFSSSLLYLALPSHHLNPLPSLVVCDTRGYSLPR